jgi:chromosome segregation ATPase
MSSATLEELRSHLAKSEADNLRLRQQNARLLEERDSALAGENNAVLRTKFEEFQTEREQSLRKLRAQEALVRSLLNYKPELADCHSDCRKQYKTINTLWEMSRLAMSEADVIKQALKQEISRLNDTVATLERFHLLPVKRQQQLRRDYLDDLEFDSESKMPASDDCPKSRHFSPKMSAPTAASSIRTVRRAVRPN